MAVRKKNNVSQADVVEVMSGHTRPNDKHMTKEDHLETVKAAAEFKALLDATMLDSVKHGINLTPFEQEIYETGGKVSQQLARFLSIFH